MITYKNTFEMTDVKNLLSQYFDATISPDDMIQLEILAEQVDAGLSITDESVKADLRLIHSLRVFASESLQAVAIAAPDSLEDRLNTHISMLAHESRRKHRKMLRAHITTISVAASVIALMGIIGFNHLTHNDTSSTPQILIAQTHTSDAAEESPRAIPILSEASTDRQAPSMATIKKTCPDSSKKTVKTPSKAVITEDISEKAVFLAEASEALEPLPPFTKDAYTVSEEAFKLLPSGVTAYVETSDILIHPLSTLSQSIYNIYESVEVVSEALSAIPIAFDAVGSSLLLLSEPIAANNY